jgi:hypothetical protein
LRQSYVSSSFCQFYNPSFFFHLFKYPPEDFWKIYTQLFAPVEGRRHRTAAPMLAKIQIIAATIAR